MLGWRHWAGRLGTIVLAVVALIWLYLAAVTLYPRLLTPFQLVVLADCGLLPLRDLATGELVERRSQQRQQGALAALAERDWLPAGLRLKALRELRGSAQPDPEALYRIALGLDPRRADEYALFEQALLGLCFNPDTPSELLRSPELLRRAASYACTMPPQLADYLGQASAQQIADYLANAPDSPDRWLAYKLGAELLPCLRTELTQRSGSEQHWATEITLRCSASCKAG